MSASAETPIAEAPFPLGLPILSAQWQGLEVDEIRSELGDVDAVLRRLAVRYARRVAAVSGDAGGLGAETLPAAALLLDLWRALVDKYAEDAGLDAITPAVSDPADAVTGAIRDRYVLDGDATGALLGREVLILEIAARDQALAAVNPIADLSSLVDVRPWRLMAANLNARFSSLPPLADTQMSLPVALMAPIEAHPDSLADQIGFVIDRFGHLLPERLASRALQARGSLLEQHAPRFGGPGRPEVLVIEDDEHERFTPDRDWMADVVLMAKLTHVWLSQLSETYGRDIRRLDQIPDEELDRLARWGFTGLWLIGLWERSSASRMIKQRTGNPDALSSAYSLYDYTVAHDLGGEEAFEDLKARAWQRGIRMASDMVPNHTGIYSDWVLNHPDRFLSLPEPPFPGYTFNGPNLSQDERVHIRIEDGYWEQRDAAVVFQRVDTWTGDVRYIYHGNDGTQMPWNDTAQIDYLDAEAREAVIQKILAVARRSPIIRFDAAMTLARRHVRRLWHPRPGEGGVPSRARYGAGADEFDQAMPEEFWREVVDRIQTEAPDTLLLAEAFWMMEGYFVRTLGMHRVYNSAFMNMLKMEENAKYRQTVKNVLTFSPEVLKRFVNFMNNPDERTAVEQFGKGDKYFGVSLLMVTMPGLPMFGHGQIEAFTEKYGMEYARAYWNEPVDEACVRRHEAEIFPLMRRRYLFSQARHFAFFDFETGRGVDEDVFAYSNRSGEARALVIYHNTYKHTSGWVRMSTPINVGTTDEPVMVRKQLAEALGIEPAYDRLVRFRDHRTGLWYLRGTTELAERGLFVDLDAYAAHVFLDWSVVPGNEGWGTLMERLGGHGVPDLDRQWRDIYYGPIRNAWKALVDAVRAGEGETEVALAVGEPTELERLPLPEALEAFAKVAGLEEEPLEEALREGLAAQKAMRVAAPAAGEDLLTEGEAPLMAVLMLMRAVETLDAGAVAHWGLCETTPSVGGLEDAGAVLELVLNRPAHFSIALDSDSRVRSFLHVHTHKDVEWFNRERMDALLFGWRVAEAVDALASEGAEQALELARRKMERRREAVAASGFRMANLLQELAARRITEPSGPA